MSNLTAAAVEDLMRKCLFADNEDTSNAVVIDALVIKFGFDPKRVAEHREKIQTLLADLPKDFMVDSGGGQSFLNACMTKEGEQWGEQRNVAELFALGQAAGFVQCPMPREFWAALPGGMPYYCVDLKAPPPE